MTNELIPFEFNGRSIRVVHIDGEPPLFVGKDATEILEYANGSQALQAHCKYLKSLSSLGNREGNDFNGLPGNTLLIPESDVYRLAMRSDKPVAGPFSDWLAEEVLPSIRKTGSYGIRQQIDVRDPTQLAPIILQLAEYNSELISANNKLTTENIIARPKVEFYDQYANAYGLYTLQNAGRVLGQKPNKFIGWMKQKYLFYQGGSLVPRSIYIKSGYFEVKTSVIDDVNRAQTFITPRGIQYFAKILSVQVIADIFADA